MTLLRDFSSILSLSLSSYLLSESRLCIRLLLSVSYNQAINTFDFSGNSMYNLYDEDEDSSMEERSSENAAMRDKVRNLKAKMRVLNANKKV